MTLQCLLNDKDMHDLTGFRSRLHAAAHEWQVHEAAEAHEAVERFERKLRLETRLGRQLEHCVAALQSLEAGAMLECVRDTVLPGAFVTRDGCVTSGPAEPTLESESPVVAPDVKQLQAAAGSILTWGWPTPQGFVAVVVRGPVWWDDQEFNRDYTLALCTDRLRPPDPDDERKPSLRSWLDARLDNIVIAVPDPLTLARTEVRELLELAVLDAVRDGLISP